MTGKIPLVDRLTYTLDPACLERAISPRTKAILPVHLYGQPADIDAINLIAQRHSLIVIEDAAIAERVTALRDHGRMIGPDGKRAKYEHGIVGYGERLDTLQAAILRAKLSRLSGWNKARRAIAQRYRPVPVHLQTGYAFLNTPATSLPHTERAASEILSLPIYPELSEQDQARVVRALIEA